MIQQLIQCHAEAKGSFFYQRIVACVVKFTSDMLKDDIIQHMNKQFPYVVSLILFPKFSFLKPVDDSLIEPDIECWDYSTVKIYRWPRTNTYKDS